MEKISVAIVDDNEKTVSLLETILNADDEIEVIGKAYNGLDALTIIKEKSPDVVLLDLIMPRLDGLGVLDRVRQDLDTKKAPAFIVVTAVSTEQVSEKVFELGARFFILKPFDNNLIISRIKQIGKKNKLIDFRPAIKSENRPDHDGKNLESDITNIIQEIGVPTHIKGYQYLYDAILMSVNDREMSNSITLLYSSIANLHKTTPSSVEQAISNAIDVAWNSGNMDRIEYLFGYTASNGRERPTNSEFIGLIATKIHLENKF